MNKTKKFSKKGIAIITVLGVCFVLLALGTILMADSCAHMRISQKYHYEALALHLAEGGVSKAIFELEKMSNLSNIPAYMDSPTYPELAESMGEGRFDVVVYNNITSSIDNTVSGHYIPPYSILIRSTGIIGDAGKEQYKKTVETIVNYQLVPYTVSSEGKMRMNIGVGEIRDTGEMEDPWDPGDPDKSTFSPFATNITSIDGFTGNMHCNYDGNPSYRCSLDPTIWVDLNISGGTLSSSGQVGNEATEKINLNGGNAQSGTGDKEFIKTSYSSLYSMAASNSNFISLDQHVPGIADFKGKMRNNGGKLQGKVKVLGIVGAWFDIEDVPLCGNCLPDGMSWESSTGTLVIEENRNYKWNDSLDLEDINIRVDGTSGASLFVEEDISADNIKITGEAFSLASKEDITLNNAVLNVTASEQCNGVAVYANNFTLTTDPDPGKLPDGGNKFKGIVYVKDGEIKVTNQCTGSGGSNKPNKFVLEGLVINDISDSNIDPVTKLPTIPVGLKVNNTGGADFEMELKYNPFVANAILDYTNAAVHLQPVYWKID